MNLKGILMTGVATLAVTCVAATSATTTPQTWARPFLYGNKVTTVPFKSQSVQVRTRQATLRMRFRLSPGSSRAVLSSGDVRCWLRHPLYRLYRIGLYPPGPPGYLGVATRFAFVVGRKDQANLEARMRAVYDADQQRIWNVSKVWLVCDATSRT